MKISILDSLSISVLGMVVVLIVLIILMAIIYMMSVVLKPRPKAVPAAPAAAPAPAPDEGGELRLNGVPDRTAAMVMALVADRLGASPSELRFKSIKEVEEGS